MQNHFYFKISTLTFLQEEPDEILTDEHMYTSLQAVNHTCVAFRR